MNSVDMAQALINRAKNLQEYAVELELTEPLKLNGVVPFDISINDNILVAKVYAVDFAEAVSMVHNYLESLE
jgi:hypothetical protein